MAIIKKRGCGGQRVAGCRRDLLFGGFLRPGPPSQVEFYLGQDATLGAHA